MSGEGRPGGAGVDAAGLSLAIAATRWHAEITDSLVNRAVAAAAACGIEVTGMVTLPVAPTQENLRYLTAKRDRLGHRIEGLPELNGDSHTSHADPLVEAGMRQAGK